MNHAFFTQGDFQDALLTVRRTNPMLNGPNLAQALNYMRTEIYESSVNRANIPDVAVVFSAG